MADLSQTQWDGVVPVPLHPVRQREREFNQAERLGRMLADALAVPLRLDLVRRRSATSSQTRLSRNERAENVRNAFEPRVTQRIDGTRWVVVDDVLTTGATTDAVAATLRQLGAAEVVVWTFARGV
jgi:ComF family protein